jgi:hypothetical protein
VSGISSATQWLEAGKLLVSIGWEVYKAFKDGQHAKTVAEIMAGREREGAILDRLDAQAVEHYAARAAARYP